MRCVVAALSGDRTMSARPCFPVICAVALFAVAPAFAADYDPPIIIEDAPEWVPVEVGSGWYLRGDISYNVSKPVYDFDFLGQKTDNLRFGGGVGFGYHFTDYFRADVTAGFVGMDEYSVSVPLDIDADFTVWNAMVNAYVDLGTVAGFTPYVGAGVGMVSAKHNVEIPLFGVDISERQNEFAYTLNAGVAYRVTENTSIDVGYQYLNSPKVEYLDTDTLTFKEGIDYHQVRVGLRYDLW